MAEVDDNYRKEIEKARRELRARITSDKCAPLMYRLAWNDAATYDAKGKKGGPNGSIRTKEELRHRANNGLQNATQLCDTVRTTLNLKKVSYSDLYQLAGVVAVEISGGPTIYFTPGRKDSFESPQEGLLPDADLDARDLRSTFSRMGISDDKDIVALCRGLNWGEKTQVEKHKDGSVSPANQSTEDPLKFDNSYFNKLLTEDSSLRPKMDNALLTDKNFLQYVEMYAKDEDDFFEAYAMAHEKLSELGWNLKKLNQPKGPYKKLNQPKGLIRIGIVSAVVTVILGYLLKRKKNQVKK